MGALCMWEMMRAADFDEALCPKLEGNCLEPLVLQLRNDLFQNIHSVVFQALISAPKMVNCTLAVYLYLHGTVMMSCRFSVLQLFLIFYHQPPKDYERDSFN